METFRYDPGLKGPEKDPVAGAQGRLGPIRKRHIQRNNAAVIELERQEKPLLIRARSIKNSPHRVRKTP